MTTLTHPADRARPAPFPDADHPCDQDLLAETLRCYKPHCRYLTSIGTRVRDGHLSAIAELRIPESCYIDDTGHLNAVEVNICYNQMLYYVIAKAIREGLAPEFGGWTLPDYWERRLGAVLIVKLQSSFQRPIDARHFFGEFTLGRARRFRPPGRAPGDEETLISMDTSFRYWDDNDGRCSGQVKVAVTEGAPAF
ncbi:FcoT family thioesterase [Actinomadura rugatobispora]|uniref:(2E)-enoyl-[ACP] glycyltransferase n=1 Tax=Actinomadura rugatobispora TaxID=1994 RepID=A0ABW0ZUI1_9ACTN|nr:hypothetical protein GCM10010200_001330 [Actinomadura rugatobispora]